ncbi:hypothetical protein JCM8547_009409 [Rhodosporidiobolus lusitaniae]
MQPTRWANNGASLPPEARQEGGAGGAFFSPAILESDVVPAGPDGWEQQQYKGQAYDQQQPYSADVEDQQFASPAFSSSRYAYPPTRSQPPLQRRPSMPHNLRIVSSAEAYPAAPPGNQPYSPVASTSTAYSGGSSRGYSDAGLAGIGGRKRPYEDSITSAGGYGSVGSAEEEAAMRYRRVPSGSVRGVGPATLSSYDFPGSAVQTVVEEGAQLSSYYPATAPAPPAQNAFPYLSQPTQTHAYPSSYSSTPYQDTRELDSYDSPIPSPAPSSATFPSQSYDPPQPSPAYPAPPVQQYQHYPSFSSQASISSAVPIPSPQRAYSLDATAQPYLFPYRRHRSPSESSAVPVARPRPSTSVPQSTYSSYAQCAPASSSYGAAPAHVTSKSFAYQSAAPSPVFNHSSSLESAPTYPPQIAYSQPSSFRPVTAPSSVPLQDAYAPPSSSLQALRPSRSFQPLPPLASSTSGVQYTSVSNVPRPSTSSGSSSHPNPSTTSQRVPSPPIIRPETIPSLQVASSARAVHRSSAPVLAFNPAREPASTAKQRVQSEYGVTYSVASTGSSKGKAKAVEVQATCWTCGTHRSKVILRGSDLTGFAPRLSFTCLDCLPVEQKEEDTEKEKARLDRLAAKAEAADRIMLGLDEEPAEGSTSGWTSGRESSFTASPAPPGISAGLGAGASASSSVPAAVASLPNPSEHNKLAFKDSFSGAVDYIEGGTLSSAADAGSRSLLPPEETAKGLPAYLKRQALTCDVCDRIIGAGSISSLTPTPVPTFTVEVICIPCSEKYRPCSDCGGGGGRLTPGRWRCKELFPAGRRTCTLSHARNPPLTDIEYDVLRVTEIDPIRLDNLENRCRTIYWNVRLRTQARPEMLERADGLATTYAQCEKLTVDGWSLLKPLLSVDIEPTTGYRRFVGIQTSTPHRRRAKPKPGAAPKPEPEEEPVEKEVSGFLLVEHDFKTGALFIAVTMPWAIAGDAFDATTVLMDETIKRVRGDVNDVNIARAQKGLEPYPDVWCIWGITPFKADSRMTQALSRRGLIFLEDYVVERPDIDLTIFPPHRQIHIPNEFVKTFKIFIRSVTAEDGVGNPPVSVGGKSNGIKTAKTAKARRGKVAAAK